MWGALRAVLVCIVCYFEGSEAGRVLVLGVHHSATSIVTRALNLLGLYVGDQDSLLLDNANPLKYWERSDVVRINQQRLREHTVPRSGFPDFVGFGFAVTHAATNGSAARQAVIEELDAHLPWVAKDPRLSLLASEWLAQLDQQAICVLTVRHPLDFANTMMRYSQKVPIASWVGVWHHYMSTALHECKSHAVAVVEHSQLVREPMIALSALHARLTSLGVRMNVLDANELVAQLGLGRPPAMPHWVSGELAALSPAVSELYEALRAAALSQSAPLPDPEPTSWPPLPTNQGHANPTARGASEAYATILTTADKMYLASALALGSSICGLDVSGREMVVLVTPAVPVEWHEELAAVGWNVRTVEELPEFWWKRHPRCYEYQADQDARWGKMMTKLRLWQLTQYDKVLYLDADTLLLSDPSSLFTRPGFTAEAGTSHSGFNAGAMVLEPSLTVFSELLRRGQGPPPRIFNSAVDCTEQALLNSHFDGRDQFHTPQRFIVAHPFDPAVPPSAVVVHWITLICPKPWDHNPVLVKPLEPGCNPELYNYWWRLYNRTGSMSLKGLPSRSFVRRMSEYGGCFTGCPDEWVNDGVCDAACNVEACSFDGKDCFHDSGECWSEVDGKDYRGKVSVTKSGKQCQHWSSQVPWHHTRTTINYLTSGLGGHNFCRNPDGEPGAWCYTLDYPNTRFELCDVGERSEACDDNGNVVSGGVADVKSAVLKPKSMLPIGQFVDGHVKELQLFSYVTELPASMAGVKVVLLPINGDADLFVSFDEPEPDRRTAMWVEESVGVKQFTLPANSEYFCGSATAESGSGDPPCHLYLTVSGFEEGDYKLIVYNYSQDTTQMPVTPSCSPGCNELSLGNTFCDSACNTSACIWDQGDCGYYGEYELEDLCAAGCPLSWLGDSYCDEACFNAACAWDESDCITADSGCADGCLPSWIDDQECDEMCNNEACGWDGTDCDHGADECYEHADGTDYRGMRSTTINGYECQFWSHQTPNQHTRTHLNHPNDGLGGHNYCRNPTGEEAHPWCYTMHPGVRFELCDVPPPSFNCSIKDSKNPYHYHTLCPVDCAALLGDGLCQIRCNISSCAFDRGDCGVGLELAMIVAGYTSPPNQRMIYILVGSGIIVGILIGLVILRLVLFKKKKEDERRRGYTDAEMKGMDNVHPDDLVDG